MAEHKDKKTGPNGRSKGNGRDDNEIHIEVLDADDTPPSAIDEGETFAAGTTAEEIPAFEKQLEELRREKEDLYDRLLRKHADFENFRKRTEKDKREFQQYALSSFMLELVSILDNFERALSHSEDQSGAEYRKGIELIYRQLKDLTEKRGLRPIVSKGQAFDPKFHEAIARELRNDLPENTILDEMQKGYFLHDKLLRPAMVKVSYQSDAENPAEGANEDDQENLGSGEEWETNES